VSTGRESLNDIKTKVAAIEREVGEHVADKGRLAVIQAPPGSGKTWLLLKTAAAAFRLGRRVAIATQTNAQANDICRRFARDYPKLRVIRFASGQSAQLELGNSIEWETETKELPIEKCIVVATSAKWSLVNMHDPFDVVFVEEAWQMGWADFMLLGQVAERFVLIGDPGQISPVVSVDVSRWETSPRPPHIAAPRVILDDPRQRPEQWKLPATRRLPHDAAGLVRQFYDFDFGATAQPGERAILTSSGGKGSDDRVIDTMQSWQSMRLY
jgi:superfamily I DNA and/or RNA helicase